MAATVWVFGNPGNYHDVRCQCARHCRNCWADMTGLGDPAQYSSRARYCSDYCRGRAKRERALDRRLSSH